MRGRSRKTRAAYGMRALRSRGGSAVQSLASHRLAELPLVRQPGIQFAQFRLWQVHQQLREIQLWINLVPAAGTGQASQSCECATATWVADKKGILSVQHHAFHFALACIVIDRHRPVRAENVQLRPVIQRSEEHTSELQSQSNLVCRLLLEKKETTDQTLPMHTL